MSKNKKAVLEGEFSSEPESGRFSYARTRKGITLKLLNFKKDEKFVFTRVQGFKVEDDGFTIDLKFNKFIFPNEADGIKQEEALTDLLGEIEEFFSIGRDYDSSKAETMEQNEGILSVGYFKDLREEED